jgi:hypothetical protein
MPDEKPKPKQFSAAWLLLAIPAIWFFAGDGFDFSGESRLSEIHAKVAADSVEKYNIAKRQGSPVDVCVHAGLVAAAFLQAKDEGNYAAWKATEKRDCMNAGVPK